MKNPLNRLLKTRKIAHPHIVARQMYRFAWRRRTTRAEHFVPASSRYSFDELDEQTQAAWLDLANLILRNGNHEHRDWR